MIFKSVLLAISLVPAPTPASDPQPPTPSPQQPRQLMLAAVQQPSMQEIRLAFGRTTLTDASTQVLFTIDAKGRVHDAVLVKTTSSRALDAEILRWARKLKLAPDQGEVGLLPIRLVK